MDSNELQILMQEKMMHLPNKAHRVVSYLLRNMREAAFRSIGDVAEELDVSKAQLVRVARMLGFSGYTELKEALKEAILDQVNPSAMLARSQDMEENIAHTILRTEHANLEDTWTQLSEENIHTFCSLVEKARTVYCMGWGISSLAMESLFMRLRVMGINAYLLKRGSLTMQEQSRGITPDDLIITSALPSYVAEVTEVCEKCKERGIPIVTITDSPAAPVCRFAELSFYVSAKSPTFGSSIIAPLFLVHVLTSVLAISMGERVRKALEEQTAFLHDTRIFHPIFGLKY